MSAAEGFQPGAKLGRYVLVRPIASGGMATVWAAQLMGTRGFQKLVAVKIMHPSLRDEPDAERMFLAEARLASRIRHLNVAEVLDLGDESGALYLVMEWVHGAPLSTVLTAAQRGHPMPLPVAVRIARHVAAGLNAAHTLTDEGGNPIGLVHRDVSPQNVLVAFNGVTKVVDFGVAKVTSEASAETRFGQVKGKVAYMAPEQLRAEPLDHRVDIFATGILLYMMTTGTHPFRIPGDQRDAVQAILSDEPPVAPSRLVKDYPPRLEAVVLRALQKDRNLRFETAEELEAALARVYPPSAKEGESVREYVRALLPEVYQAGIDLARVALGSFEALTTSSSFSALAKIKPPSSSTLRAVAVSTDLGSEQSGTATLVPPIPVDEVSGKAVPGRGRAGPILIGVVGAALAAGVGFLVWPGYSTVGPDSAGAAGSSPVPAAQDGEHVQVRAAPTEVPSFEVVPEAVQPASEPPPVATPPSTTPPAPEPAATATARVATPRPRVRVLPGPAPRRPPGAAKPAVEGLKDPYE